MEKSAAAMLLLDGAAVRLLLDGAAVMLLLNGAAAMILLDGIIVFSFVEDCCQSLGRCIMAPRAEAIFDAIFMFAGHLFLLMRRKLFLFTSCSTIAKCKLMEFHSHTYFGYYRNMFVDEYKSLLDVWGVEDYLLDLPKAFDQSSV